ncbi:enoyl-CoA hydratase [Streptomyces sp. WM6372]|uniref:enoyl-CoA-hydratase DpgB n=1 Tax=Streptomyces sp. WM6372 TaxID=1415555 RepID=UPI0006ADC8E6|nr:enoyl-CoA-hydratase DpgB [Streptomyces sp. WM6372]KOU27427.1 enoyl-CoA hydratase [Streptomyces sp. WM6372]
MTETGTTSAAYDAATATLAVDGRLPLSPAAVAAVNAACDGAEDGHTAGHLILRLSGVPAVPQADGVTVSLVSKWERALRRLERLPAATIATVQGPCGGLALDLLLCADRRIADGAASLVMPVENGTTWPGMTLYRLGRSHPGAAAVRRAVLFGTAISAQEAVALQLVDVLADDVEAVLAQAVASAASVRGSELAIRRQLLFDAATTSFEEALGAHLAACDRALLQSAVPGAAA